MCKCIVLLVEAYATPLNLIYISPAPLLDSGHGNISRAPILDSGCGNISPAPLLDSGRGNISPAPLLDSGRGNIRLLDIRKPTNVWCNDLIIFQRVQRLSTLRRRSQQSPVSSREVLLILLTSIFNFKGFCQI